MAKTARRAGPWALVTCALAISSPALAEDDPQLDRARELAIEGVLHLDAGRNEAALENLEAAFQIVKLPTLALYQARALVRLGRWVEALALYEEAAQLPVTDGDPRTQEQAHTDAERERAELEPRIPRITVHVQGIDATTVTARVDGRDVPLASLEAGYRVDPGTHRVEAQAGDQTRQVRVTVDAEQTEPATLVFDPPPLPPTAAPDTASVAGERTGTSPPAVAERPVVDDRTIPRGLAWGALGVGAAGTVVGTIAGAQAIDKRTWLDDRCGGTDCPPPYHADVDTYRRQRVVATTGFVVGGAGLATGIALWIARSPRDPVEARTITPWVGFDRVGVSGRF